MRHFIVPITSIFVLILLHSIVRYHIASVFLLPISIPILIATAIPLPTIAIGFVLILLELFSSLPQGSMLLVFLIPFFTQYMMPWATPVASWKFFGYVGITVCLQLFLLIGISLFDMHITLTTIPLSVTILQIIGTSVSTFISAILCYELRDH